MEKKREQGGVEEQKNPIVSRSQSHHYHDRAGMMLLRRFVVLNALHSHPLGYVTKKLFLQYKKFRFSLGVFL